MSDKDIKSPKRWPRYWKLMGYKELRFEMDGLEYHAFWFMKKGKAAHFAICANEKEWKEITVLEAVGEVFPRTVVKEYFKESLLRIRLFWLQYIRRIPDTSYILRSDPSLQGCIEPDFQSAASPDPEKNKT
jgi:hypothetical protein